MEETKLNHKNITKGEKYLYLLLYAPDHTGKTNAPIEGRVKLQKQMHVLSKMIPRKTGFSFKAGRFGAYCDKLAGIVDYEIESKNIIGSERINASDMTPIKLSPKTIGIGKILWSECPDEEKAKILRTKELNEMSREETIAYHYATFPETTKNSEILDKFEKTRLASAVSLFKRKRISLGKASEIAGLSRDEFEDELRDRGITPYTSTKEQYERSRKLIECHP